MALLLVVTNCAEISSIKHKTGWYLPEVAHPFKVFKEAGISMTIVSPNGGKAPLDPGSVEATKKDPVCTTLYADQQWMEQFNKTTAISDIDVTKYKVIFFAGGHGPMFDLPDCAAMNNAAAKIFENGGIVAGVCHGVVGLLNVKLPSGEWLVKGHKVTSFTNEEEDLMKLSEAMPFMLETALVEHGVQFDAAPPFQEKVHVSDRIITGQNPASATPMAQRIVEKMKELEFC